MPTEQQAQALADFKREVNHAALPLERKLAAILFVERIAAGDDVAQVIKDLAEPLGITPQIIMRAIVPQSGTRH